MVAQNHDLADQSIFPSDHDSNTLPPSSPNPKKHKLRQLVSRTGICYDNAITEPFFAALKNELAQLNWAARGVSSC